jgi:RimJ/RimL family protein N-acetyltransferase
MAHPCWPLFDLEVRTPRLVLRYADDALGVELVRVVLTEGVHDPAWMPFVVPWTDLSSPELERQAMQYWWRCRATTSPESWDLNLAVIVDGLPVGVTSIGAVDFPITATFQTGSWLGRSSHGRGIGTEMRAATLHLGFAGFGAQRATTTAFADNGPSLGVTRRLGYVPNGTSIGIRREQPAEQEHFVLTREAWSAQRRDDIELVGVAAACDQLGIAAPGDDVVHWPA